jgi:hypothetical protein
MIMSIKLQAVGLALIAFTGCASPSDRLYQEAMARYYQTIKTGGPLVPAYKVTGEKPYQNPLPKTYDLYDRQWRLQGHIKEWKY